VELLYEPPPPGRFRRALQAVRAVCLQTPMHFAAAEAAGSVRAKRGYHGFGELSMGSRETCDERSWTGRISFGLLLGARWHLPLQVVAPICG
jgi:hypothetical protein